MLAAWLSKETPGWLFEFKSFRFFTQYLRHLVIQNPRIHKVNRAVATITQNEVKILKTGSKLGNSGEKNLVTELSKLCCCFSVTG